MKKRKPRAVKMSNDTADREIVISRTFDAPRDVVFQAFTDPKHIDHWYGPRGFTTRYFRDWISRTAITT